MRVLAIESTCDETGAAIVEPSGNQVKIISQALASSAEIHQQYGGVVPEVAAREQLKVIIPVIETALKKAKMSGEDLDAIAVAVGPGLIGSLLVGVETAKTLALAWNKPIIPVNHLVAHVLANWIKADSGPTPPPLPALALVVSGGHTDLVYLHSLDRWEWLSGTRDDAAGECLDKCARILDLGYPGGPALEKAALAHSSGEVPHLPRPLIHDSSLDWSFSGLKSAVAQLRYSQPELDKGAIAEGVLQAVSDSLVAKIELALKQYPVRSLILAGGVAANQLLRNKLDVAAVEAGVEFYFPPFAYCTDNPGMIGAAAILRPKEMSPLEIEVDPSLEVV
jgi:N6-L-threonylcarbamoyladenine synthase